MTYQIVDPAGQPVRRINGTLLTFSDPAQAERYARGLPYKGYEAQEVTEPN